MLFAKADRKNCTAIREVLDSFCELSGQKVSNDKSRVYFSPNVDLKKRTKLCEILSFRSTPSLGNYLGFPIKHSGTPQDFDTSLIVLRASWLVGKPTYCLLLVELF